jgi:hypothetical protein
MEAAYVFRVRFRLAPETGRVSPAAFETVFERPAAPPGEEGWLFFRNALWRGQVGDEQHLRELATGWLGVPVTGVTFSELRTDEAYLESLKTHVGRELETFNADDVPEVLHKYLGSSIHVREREE